MILTPLHHLLSSFGGKRELSPLPFISSSRLHTKADISFSGLATQHHHQVSSSPLFILSQYIKLLAIIFLFGFRLRLLSRENLSSGGLFEIVTQRGKLDTRYLGGRARHAFIGLGFRERPEAYDFQAALHDHMKRYLNKKKTAEEMEQQYQQNSSVNYSLKEGETLVLQIKNSGGFGVKSKLLRLKRPWRWLMRIKRLKWWQSLMVQS